MVRSCWVRPVSTRRMVGANCDVVFDFDWYSAFGHNQPRFSGLHDLTFAVDQQAKRLGLQPILLLTDDATVGFCQIFQNGAYIAVVNVHRFRACTVGHDRSALFFLREMGGTGHIDALGRSREGLESTMLALRTLLGGSVTNTHTALVELSREYGAEILCALVNLSVEALKKNVERSDFEVLTRTVMNNSAEFLADLVTTTHRRGAIIEFETLLSGSANEQAFQRWFEENSWVLSANCVRILDERQIDVKHVADYLVEALDGRADVVEIKRPGLAFWRSSQDHGNYVPHGELVEAITQAQNYQHELEREMDSIKTRERLNGVPIAKPSSLLIHGRSNRWNDKQFEAQRLLNAGFTNVCVITYDQVLLRAKALTSFHEG